jgi:hypothetical protein
MSGRGVWSRSRQRLLHLVLGTVLGLFLYSPLRDVAAVELAVQVVVFPALVLSGVLLWQGYRVRQWLAR